MSRLLINPGIWMLDLSNILLNKSENNSFFSDSFFGTITFPFDINIDSEFEQFIYHYNQSGYQKVYDKLILNENGNLEECQLIILSFEGKKMSAQLVIGFENFPNFDKKLSELPLYQSDLSGETLYSHANRLVDKTYPEVNYTFPAVHTDSIDTSNNLFSSFKGTYNLRQNGNFVENSKSGSTIRNLSLLEPAVSLIYVLKTGFTAAGYTLKGNILDNELLNKTFIFSPVSYSAEKYPAQVGWLVLRYEYSEVISHESLFSVYRYKVEQEIPFHGKFRIVGSIDFDGDSPVEAGEFDFMYNGKSLYHLIGEGKHMSFDFTFINDPSTGSILTLEGILASGSMDRNLMACDIIPLEIYDEEGNVYNPNFNNPRIDLTQNVPDISFGDLVKVLKNMFNFDVYRNGKEIVMNFIESEIKSFSDALDYSSYEIREPLITFNEDRSFLLKYSYEGEDYTFDSLYVDKSGAKSTGYAKQENTTEISCQAIPLPIATKNNLDTARTLTEDKNSMQLVIYEGLKAGKNETLENTPYLWPDLYKSFWKEWMSFRIQSDTFKWKFKALKEATESLTVKKKIYAYGKYHIINKLSKQDLSVDSQEIELETNSE